MNKPGRRQKDFDQIRELLKMAAVANTKHISEHDREMKELRKELRGYAKEHDRDIKEIRALLRKLTPAKVRAFKARLRKARGKHSQ